MRGPKLIPFFFSLKIGEDQKKGFRVRRCHVFTENVSENQKKRFSLFVIRPLIFSEALGFSLLSRDVLNRYF